MSMRIYAFERIDDALDLVPLVARRALDTAGCKISLEAWRAAPIASRRAIAGLGETAHVAPADVRAALNLAGIAFTEVEPWGEIAASAPPADAPIPVPPARWAALTPLDRYALVKIARGKHPENLARALAEIAPPLSTHLNARGEAVMVDVGAKEMTARVAIAHAHVAMQPATVARLRAGDTPKGDVLATARIAGIQAAKRTPDLIPLCHAIALTKVSVDLTIADDGIAIDARAEARDRTGVEMEALTAATVAALTIYDMLKGVDRGMSIRAELSRKEGGKTGTWTRD
jgi:cyclic pyranopterin phosphate synthase